MQEKIRRLLVELGRLRQEYRKGRRKRPGTPEDNYRLDQQQALVSDKEAELNAAKTEFEKKTGRPWY